VNALEFADARRLVIDTVRAASPTCVFETVTLANAAGRVLASDVFADRAYPPVDRSIRDGFAVRAADLPGTLRIAGEVRAGASYEGAVAAGECVRIMTGAPVPQGADAVVMIEHTRLDGSVMTTDRSPSAGEFINRAGCEAGAGEVVLRAGTVLRYPHIAMLATVGAGELKVVRRPVVSILATGDEIVPVEATPREFEVRNSNSWALAAQVAEAGGVPRVLPVAPDDLAVTRARIEEALSTDLLLLSGGVSAGEYDYVEAALAQLGAEFFFTRVKIRPGAPLVFGRARGTFFFGLPGNPLSTAVTYAVFARAAQELLGGIAEPALTMTEARITTTLREKPGLTRFLPAHLDDGRVRPIFWKGSSDVPSLAKSNCYIVATAERELYKEGEHVPVLIA
jgi:molybdopterin molybdotransferase